MAAVGLVGRLVRDPAGAIGVIGVLCACLAALLAPVIAPHDPSEIHAGARLLSPGGEFLLGTDELGRDLLSRIIYGARVALLVAFGAVTLAAVVGVPVGVLAALAGGRREALAMRVTDILFAFPPFLLALGIIAVLGSALANLVLALALVYAPTFARVSRASALVILREQYFEAGRSIGAGRLRLLFRYVLPNALDPILVLFTVNLAFAIVVEASLSFLGLGVQPPTPSWGAMLSQGKLFVELSPWPAIVSGAAIMATVLAFNLLGDALRDVLDPRTGT